MEHTCGRLREWIVPTWTFCVGWPKKSHLKCVLKVHAQLCENALNIFFTVKLRLMSKYRAIYRRFDALRGPILRVYARTRGRTCGKCPFVAKAQYLKLIFDHRAPRE